MIHNNTDMTEMNVLYHDNHLADLYDVLDQLHTAASEGDWQKMTTMSKRELLALLHDFVYTAQETIREIEEDQPTVYLRLLEKPMADKLQA